MAVNNAATDKPLQYRHYSILLSIYCIVVLSEYPNVFQACTAVKLSDSVMVLSNTSLAMIIQKHNIYDSHL